MKNDKRRLTFETKMSALINKIPTSDLRNKVCDFNIAVLTAIDGNDNCARLAFDICHTDITFVFADIRPDLIVIIEDLLNTYQPDEAITLRFFLRCSLDKLKLKR